MRKTPTRVDIINNPYLQRLQILIDGEAVSIYSGLEKFMDEPFVYWCDKILPAIYVELNSSSFSLHFKSSKEEADIMEIIASQTPYCTQYTSSGFVRKTTLVERMAKLNDLIKVNALTGYRRQNCVAVFVVPEKMSSLCSEFKQIEIKNLYCNVEVIAITYNEFLQNPIKSDVTFIVCEKGNEKASIGKLSVHQGFLISIGQENRFTQKTDEVLYYETTIQNLFNTIFTCFIVGPLERIFTQSVESLSADIKSRFKDNIECLLSTSLRVIPKPESLTVETGHSVQLSFDADIDGYEFQKTDFIFDYKPKGIIKCNGIRVEGIKAGKATLYVYREGENRPCAELLYTVVQRNRITELQIEEKTVFIGERDRYSLDYTFFPADADNVNKIVWESEDESIVQIDDKGNIRALKAGDCVVRVIAENVSDNCKIHVLPHIKDISVDDNDIILLPGESMQISAKPLPDICIDSKLKYACLDVRVANIIGTELKAIGLGETYLVIQNIEETITKKIRVIVDKKKSNGSKSIGKKGLLAKFFG